jgi:hypothetical protein
MVDHTACKKLERYSIIDPCDQVVRVFVCAHGVHDYMYPKQMMIVWPDGKTSTWENKQ